MCSYQSITRTSQCNLHFENWEGDLWENVIDPDPMPSSNTSNFQYKYPQTSATQQTPFIQTVSEQNVTSTTTSQDYQMEISTAYVESSSVMSPSWEDSNIETPQNSMTMSTYFSSFNPTSQFMDSANQSPVTRTCLLKTKKSAEKDKHCARISLLPAGNGNLKAIVKRKRKRTIFTTEQIEVLEEVFSRKPYVTRDERHQLVELLQVNDKSIKVWFQNRRLKNKRGDDQDEVLHVDKNAILERLNSVESEINERADEFGYVTLDDKIMTELVNVIDDYFTNNISLVETKSEIDNSPIYEPISPVSTSDYSCEENATCWQHYEPNEIVQELIDIESIISK